MKTNFLAFCLFTFCLYGLYGLLPRASALTFESSQYRITTTENKTPSSQSNQDNFPIQGYVLTESPAVAPYDDQNSSDLTIAPMIVKLLIKRDQTVDINFDLDNRGDPELISLKIVPLKDKNNPAILFTPSAPLFLAKGKATIKLTVTIPAEVEEQDYYYKVIFEKNIRQKTVKEAEEALSGLLLITVSDRGRTQTKAYLDDLIIAKSWRLRFWDRDFRIIDWFSAPAVKVSLQNRGRNFFQAQGRLIVQKPNGQELVLGIKPVLVLVHPDKIGINLPAPRLSPGRYQISVRLAAAGPGLTPTEATLSENIVFYVLPIKLLTIIIIAALIIFVIKTEVRKRLINPQSASPPD